jgi:hypothetical protein
MADECGEAAERVIEGAIGSSPMVNELERENRELRQANEILRKGEPVKAPLVQAHWQTRILHRGSSTDRFANDGFH